ncbi:MAG: SBBP repeat-containing protein [Pirellula sp.]
MTPRARRSTHHGVRLLLELLEDRRLLSGEPLEATGYGNLPLAFEANQGQVAAQVDFIARGSGYMMSLAPSEAALNLRNSTGDDTLKIQFVGANPQAQVACLDELITKTNYLIGSDPSHWQTDISNYGKVEYQDVYAGIDLVYYGSQGELEYDFIVAPGVDPGIIQLSFDGAEQIELDGQGNLVLHTSGGVVVQEAPVIYQELDGARQLVRGQFVLMSDHHVGFEIGMYDQSRTLVIDPILSYSTYFGGSGSDRGDAITVDSDGNAYITGYTYSANLPTTAGVLQNAKSGTNQTRDVFVAKLNAAGTALVYSTYLGGTRDEVANSIAVDASGNAYVTGATESSNFPVSAGAFQQTNSAFFGIGFVTKLNSSGSALLYSTYLGGSEGFATSRAIAVDGAGNAYVTGDTSSVDFPTQNPLQPIHADEFLGQTSGYSDAFVSKLNATGTALVYSTYLGGTYYDQGNGIAVDAAGNAFVTGSAHTYATSPSGSSKAFPTTSDAFQPTNATPPGSSVPFVTKLDASGSAMVYSTFLGGTAASNDWAQAIAVDSVGIAYVTGSTQASDFPTTPGAFQSTRGGSFDAFVSALNASGSALVYSTFLGGSKTDQPLDIAVDTAGNAHVIGGTQSSNFPISNAVQPLLGGGNDAFVTKLNASGSGLTYSTYLGGSNFDFGNSIAIGPDGSAFLTGFTDSTNFNTTSGSFDTSANGGDDAFVAKLISSSALVISDVSIIEGNAGTVSAQFTVSLSDGGSQTVTVNYGTFDGTATSGSDYQSLSGILTFAPGETSKTVVVPVYGDLVLEANETFFVDLSSPSNALIADSRGVATIRDDDTTKFYVVNDASADQTYRYGAPGNSLGNSALTTGNTAPRGIASNAAGNTVWVADANRKVYVYNASGGVLGSWTAGTLSSTAQVEGITTNGTDVWIVDNKTDKVFKYTAAAGLLSGSQNSSSSFSLNRNNSNAKGIVTDGTSIWVINDSATDKVFKYSLTGTLLGSWTIDPANSSPTGLTIDPNNVSNIWTVDSGTKKVYQYTAAASLVSGSQLAAVTFALTAGNTNPQDIADPPFDLESVSMPVSVARVDSLTAAANMAIRGMQAPLVTVASLGVAPAMPLLGTPPSIISSSTLPRVQTTVRNTDEFMRTLGRSAHMPQSPWSIARKSISHVEIDEFEMAEGIDDWIGLIAYNLGS